MTDRAAIAARHAGSHLCAGDIGHERYHADLPCDAARLLAEPAPIDVERLRSPRNSLGKLALPKGPMERAVEEAWEKAITPLGDGVEMHDLAVLADAICDALAAEYIRLAVPE